MRVHKTTVVITTLVVVLMAAITSHITIKDITLQSKYNALLTEVQEQEHAVPEAEEAVSTVEQSYIDTHYITGWCSGCGEDGTVRMVGAWWYSAEEVEDETGNIWYTDTTIDPLDNVLLWIADNNTPEDVTDDIVVKMWVEVHG